jgi:tryptophanyl-tRNA synthetase
LQHEHECLFFVADWHALTTHYDRSANIEDSTWQMVIDWLAVGVDPDKATLFIQSQVIEHAELHLMLSMVTPNAWLERMPTYKDQQEKLADRDLSTYGFLGYPLLQSADILIYRANQVPVGEDQVPHIEFAREIARRFNHLFGREPGYEEKAKAAMKKLGNARLYDELRMRYQQKGDVEALVSARTLLAETQNLSLSDRERLYGFIEGCGRVILTEPQALLTAASKMPGLDGQKMSKSYHNTLSLREAPDSVSKKIRTMPTDPARMRRTDPGSPEKCPVWQFHEVYSSETVREWVKNGCRSAGIGCIECKQPVIDAVLSELAPIQARAREFEESPDVVRNILARGCEKARDLARETMRDVRGSLGLPQL